jgi:DNA-binding response OmpR family regulator
MEDSALIPNKAVLLSSENPKILLVEDNPDLRNFIQLMLSEFYDVETAHNGKEALELLQRTSLPPEGSSTAYRLPSLILSDIMMPVMDGLELLEAVKTSDHFRHIPMVMLTARTSMDAKLSALQLGVDDYITKPFHEDELLARIENILKNQAARLLFLQEEGNETSEPVVSAEALLHISESDRNWLSEAEAVVNDNLNSSQFSKLEWADTLHVSERHLRRKIKELTGLTLTKYIQLTRLKIARKLLEAGTKTTVAEVAYAVGFETPKYFSKLFHQEYGRKPVDYFR